MTDADRYSIHKLQEFFSLVISRGLMKKATAESRRTAVMKVLGVLDDDAKQDLREIDRDDAFNRFQNLTAQDYSPDSLAIYRTRFNAALDDFIRWAENPAGFRSAVATRTARRPRPVNGGREARLPELPLQDEPSPFAFSAEPETPRPSVYDCLDIPVPLRKGVVVRIHGLPSDLTVDEASKITAVVNAYAVPLRDSM